MQLRGGVVYLSILGGGFGGDCTEGADGGCRCGATTDRGEDPPGGYGVGGCCSGVVETVTGEERSDEGVDGGGELSRGAL